MCLFILSDPPLFCQAIGDLSHTHRLHLSFTVCFHSSSGSPAGQCAHPDVHTGSGPAEPPPFTGGHL